VIARLVGNLVSKNPTGSVVDVGGVGYVVLHSTYTYETLRPGPDGKVPDLTYLHVREEALQLFGFSEDEERRVFELLLGVAGVGPKLALAVLSGLTPPAFARAVLDENLAALTRISGVGRKTAERIVIDLRDKLATIGIVPDASGAPAVAKKRGAAAEPSAPSGLPGRLYEDTLSALTALGLARPAAIEQVRKALEAGPVDKVEELVRRALAAGGKKPLAKPTSKPRVGV
jgi:Holliday junction DNA helicase RuvA